MINLWRAPAPPFKPGNLDLKAIQGQAPLEFYLLRSIRDPDSRRWGEVATINRAKMFIPSKHLFVWTYAGYWAKLESGVDAMVFYADKESALNGLMRWKLQTGLPVFIDEKLI